MATIKIRQNECDFLIYRLHMRTLPDDDFDDDFSVTYWVAWDESKPVGFCGIKPVKNDEDTAFLCCAGVVESHQGQGIQKKMIKVRERWARKHEFKKLITYVWWQNPASANSLIACGFKIYRPEYAWAGYDFLYLYKDIN